MVQFNARNKQQYNEAAVHLGKLTPLSAGGHLELMMDLAAADGKNGNLPIDWSYLLAAKNDDFLHDICGIKRFIDRETGKLGGCFLPRYAAHPDRDERARNTPPATGTRGT